VKKPFIASIDVLGESHIPADLLTPTMGSSYLLEGYEDMDYGSGVMYGGRGLVPPTPDSVAVPTGINRGASDQMNLGELLKDASALVEHSWMEDVVQDLSRLPENPVHIVPELEELWGNNRPTDGVRVYQKDRVVEAPVKQATDRTLTSFVTLAMRRSASGHPLEDILRDTYLDVGVLDAPRIRASMDLMKSEHGLAGNVFIRHSAYPKYEQGKWTEHLRRTAKDALYLVVTPEVMKSATWIQDGRCTLTGKQAVVEIPWREAYSHYAPRLRDSGRRVASGDPREALRRAFLSLPEKKVATGDALPVHVTPSERVSMEDARVAFANTKVERKVYDPTVAHQARVRAALHRKLASLSENGVLSPLDRDRLMASSAHPKDVLRAAADLAGAVKNGTYEGARMTIFSGLTKASDSETVASAWESSRKASQQQRVASAVAKIHKAIDHGIRGAALKDVILRTVHPEDIRVAGSILDPVLRETQALEEPNHDHPVYAGAKYAAHTARKVASVVSPNTVQSVVRWIRRAMNEGFAGNNLNDLIENRFASDVLAASSEEIDSIRRAHEGGAGFLYVEAAAYATTDGVKGCEQGALKHRANQVKTLLAVPNKCGSCVHARTLEDGTPRCAIYNKIIVNAADFGSDLERLKQANIRTANQTDQEQTASLFSPTYDANEFNLHNASLDDFDYAPLPDNKKVADIAFGGLIIRSDSE
jgi:hypothetical protein